MIILSFLHYRELHDGTSIKENGIMDGSKIILLPNVETGLLVITIFIVINLLSSWFKRVYRFNFST